MAGADKTASLFTIEPPARLLFDRAAPTQTAVLNLKRISKDFKTGVTINGSLLAPGWSLSTKADKDLLTLTLTRPTVDASPDNREPTQLPLLVYAELPDRIRWETIQLPVKWIDRPQRIETYPANIELEGPNAQQQIVVTGFDAAGQARDWTHEISIVSTNPAIAVVQ